MNSQKRKLLHRLFDPAPLGRVGATAIVIAVVYVLSMFSISYLLGTAPFWHNPRGPWLMDPADSGTNFDIMTSLSGYVAYVKSPWEFPLFFVPSLGVPAGTNIIFLDSIPLLAIFGKIIAGATGCIVNPYGLWIALCFVLSAALASSCLVQLGRNDLASAAVAAIFVISAPPLLHRFGHLSLMGHFVIIGAFCLYLRDRRHCPVAGQSLLWSAWLGLACLVNMYLFVMAGAFLAASVLTRRDDKPHGARDAWIISLAAAMSVALVMIVAGHFGRGSSGTPFGFGFGAYSMNLVSPFWPQRSGLLPGFDAIVDATGGQYEGFAYLGAGGIGMVIAGLWLARRELVGVMRRHHRLLFVLAALFVFSLSDQVFAWNHLILDYRINPKIDLVFSVFRSSGRMFWPVYYTALLCSIASCLRPPVSIARASMVFGLCILQLIDTNPLRARIADLAGVVLKPFNLDVEWKERLRLASEVVVIPSVQCGGDSGVNMELIWWSAAFLKPINAVYNPRRYDDCVAERQLATTAPPTPGRLFVLLAGGGGGVPPAAPRPDLHCETFPEGVWCLEAGAAGSRSAPPAGPGAQRR